MCMSYTESKHLTRLSPSATPRVSSRATAADLALPHHCTKIVTSREPHPQLSLSPARLPPSFYSSSTTTLGKEPYFLFHS